MVTGLLCPDCSCVNIVLFEFSVVATSLINCLCATTTVLYYVDLKDVTSCKNVHHMIIELMLPFSF